MLTYLSEELIRLPETFLCYSPPDESQVLTYADVCRRVPTYADVCATARQTRVSGAEVTHGIALTKPLPALTKPLPGAGRVSASCICSGLKHGIALTKPLPALTKPLPGAGRVAAALRLPRCALFRP